MFHHVGEWSRVVARDYRHHPLVSIFYLCFDDTTFSHCLAPHRDLVQGYRSRRSPASSHRAPFMISFSFHAATEHSEFNSLVMYARRKIVSGSDMFSTATGYLDGGSPHISENGARRYGVPDRVPGYVVSVYVLMLAYPRGSSLSISISRKELCPNNSI